MRGRELAQERDDLRRRRTGRDGHGVLGRSDRVVGRRLNHERRVVMESGVSGQDLVGVGIVGPEGEHDHVGIGGERAGLPGEHRAV